MPSVIFLSFAERTNELLNKMYFQNVLNIQHFVTVGCEISCPTVTRCDCCRILNLPTNTQSHYVHSSLLRYHRPILSISLPLIQLIFRLHTSQSVARFVVGIQNHIQMSLARCSDSQVVGRRFLCSRYLRFEFPDFSLNICIF